VHLVDPLLDAPPLQKRRLEEYEPDSTVASILMSLSSGPSTEPSCESKTTEHQQNTLPSVVPGQSEASAEAKTFAAQAMERIRQQISATLSDEEELEIGSDFQLRDKTQCTTQQLETIRRERNRMHAKKTRLRKKKMLTEMETVSVFVLWLVNVVLPVFSSRSGAPFCETCGPYTRSVFVLLHPSQIISCFERDIRELKRKLNLLPASELEGRPIISNVSGSSLGSGVSSVNSGTASGSSDPTKTTGKPEPCAAEAGARYPTKFTGFRHLTNKTCNGVTQISGLRGASGGSSMSSGNSPRSTPSLPAGAGTGAGAGRTSAAVSPVSTGTRHDPPRAVTHVVPQLSPTAQAGLHLPPTQLSALPLNLVLSMFPLPPAQAAALQATYSMNLPPGGEFGGMMGGHNVVWPMPQLVLPPWSTASSYGIHGGSIPSELNTSSVVSGGCSVVTSHTGSTTSDSGNSSPTAESAQTLTSTGTEAK
jgi:hypothetical protein